MYVIIPISSTGSDSVIHTIRLSLSSIVASHMTHPLLSPLKFRTPLYPFIVTSSWIGYSIKISGLSLLTWSCPIISTSFIGSSVIASSWIILYKLFFFPPSGLYWLIFSIRFLFISSFSVPLERLTSIPNRS